MLVRHSLHTAALALPLVAFAPSLDSHAMASGESSELCDSDRVEHRLFDRLLSKHVNASGRVDWPALAKEGVLLDKYLALLARTDVKKLSDDERKAFYLNAYNAATMRLVLDHYPIDSILDVPEELRWSKERWRIGGATWSLETLFNDAILPSFDDERAWFAVSRASCGGPPLRNEAYTATNLARQLDDQRERVLTDERIVALDADAGEVRLAGFLDWFDGSLTSSRDSILDYLSKHRADILAAKVADADLDVVWLDHDWALNEVEKDAQ